MMRKTLLLLAMSIAACGTSSAASLLIGASGQFSSLDTADSPLVAPNGLFSLSFLVNTNPTPVAGTVTSLEFDVPVTNFLYRLNGAPIAVTPSEITFYTLADGGLFQVGIGSGLSASDFVFQGAQAFSGTTAAPVFTTGQYQVSNWSYSDPANFDVETSGPVTIAVTPEPSTLLLISCGLGALIARNFRKH